MEIPYVVKNTLDAPDLREELGAQGSLRESADEENDGSVNAEEEIDDENSGPIFCCNEVHVVFSIIIVFWMRP